MLEKQLDSAPVFEVKEEDRKSYPGLTDEQIIACDKLSHSWKEQEKDDLEFKESFPVEHRKREMRIKWNLFKKKYLNY